MAIYVPRVLVCGNIEEFRKKIGDKSVEVVGQIIFEKKEEDVKLFFGEKILTSEDISKILDGAAEYLIFTDALEFCFYLFLSKLLREKITAVFSHWKCF